jgi:hypothetical protein
MREIRTSGVTREGVAGLRTRPLYSTVFAVNPYRLSLSILTIRCSCLTLTSVPAG